MTAEMNLCLYMVFGKVFSFIEAGLDEPIAGLVYCKVYNLGYVEHYLTLFQSELRYIFYRQADG